MQTAQHQRHLLPARSPVDSSVDENWPWRLGEAAGRAARFLLHFAEMWIVMLLGMASVDPVKLGLAARGYTSLLDPMSIDSEVEMMVFMVTPVVLWMRARGWRWRDDAEMAIAMLAPGAAVLVAGHLGLSTALPWFSMSVCTATLVGMLAIMLYRRDRSTQVATLSSGGEVRQASRGR